MIYPVILCGGSGIRLWPLSSQERPKQLISFFNGKSLCQQTALRFMEYGGFEAPIFVCGERYADIIERQLKDIGLTDYHLVVEPMGKDTAPAIALAAEYIYKTNPTGTLLAIPSDHYIQNPDCFFSAVKEAEAQLSQKTGFILFGVKPTYPETGYGYIKPGEPFLEDRPHIFQIEEFLEKPDTSVADRCIKEGYVWNAGIFLLPAKAYLEELAFLAPGITDAVQSALQHSKVKKRVVFADGVHFKNSPAISIDHAVMEKTGKAGVIIIENAGWKDVGSWNAVWEIFNKDEHGTACVGDVYSKDCTDSLILAQSGKVVAIGAENLIIVHTPEATIVLPRERSQELKEIVKNLLTAKA